MQMFTKNPPENNPFCCDFKDSYGNRRLYRYNNRNLGQNCGKKCKGGGFSYFTCKLLTFYEGGICKVENCMTFRVFSKPETSYY